MSPIRAVLTAAGVLLAASLRAEIYELPPEGYDVVGAVATVIAREEDTLIDIARRNGLGYHDIVRANPDVNIWVPGAGTEVVLPTRFVLPPGPRRGIVLNLAEYRLYYYPEPAEGEPAYVMTYPISIGRMDWETPLGSTSVVSKVTDPSWYPPQSSCRPDLKTRSASTPCGSDCPDTSFTALTGLRASACALRMAVFECFPKISNTCFRM
jgi:L,D-transpeptidase ErfK/SrfK